MTLSLQNIGRTRMDVEPNGAFANELTLPGNFFDVPVLEGTGKLVMDRPYESPMLLQQHIDGQPLKVPMPRRAKYDFQMCMRGTAARAGGAQLTSNTLLAGGPLLAVAMGATHFGTGTTITTGATTTSLPCTSASGFTEGGAIVCATGAGGALECREIKTKSSNTLTLHHALSSAPANGSTVYACATYYMSNLDGSTVTFAQMLVEGYDALDRWLLKGGAIAAPPKFTLTPGTIPKIDWSWQFANHLKADGTETTMNPASSAIADQNYASTSINAVMDSQFYMRVHGSSTLAGTLVDASEINIEPNIAYEPHISPGGVNNIVRWMRTRAQGPTAAGNFLLPYESAAFRTARDANTAYSLYYQVGSSLANGGFMISVPHVQLDNFQREPVGGIAGQRVSFAARLDSQTTTNLSALEKSALRVHLF